MRPRLGALGQLGDPSPPRRRSRANAVPRRATFSQSPVSARSGRAPPRVPRGDRAVGRGELGHRAGPVRARVRMSQARSRWIRQRGWRVRCARATERARGAWIAAGDHEHRRARPARPPAPAPASRRGRAQPHRGQPHPCTRSAHQRRPPEHRRARPAQARPTGPAGRTATSRAARKALRGRMTNGQNQRTQPRRNDSAASLGARKRSRMPPAKPGPAERVH